MTPVDYIGIALAACLGAALFGFGAVALRNHALRQEAEDKTIAACWASKGMPVRAADGRVCCIVWDPSKPPGPQ